MARKSKYQTCVKPKFEEIKEWFANGDTDIIVAKKLGIAESTFYEYLEKYPEFSKAVYEAKNITRKTQLEETLYRRATGYMVQETKTTKRTNYNGEISIEETTTSRHIPADVGALKFILVNQFGDEYKEKQELNISGNMTINLGTAESEIL